jgi:hypothetical protein
MTGQAAGSRARLRVLATNDFVGSVDPRPTSYGRLPGAHGLREAIARLRGDGSALWLDAGDFAGWSPLAGLSGGRAAFAAAAELGFDAACLGNHELDWGRDLPAAFARAAPFPLLCANVEVGLPATHVGQTPIGAVGLLGVTMPELGDLAGLPDLLLAAIAELRARGCVSVIVLLHDGVSWAHQAGRDPEPDPAEFLARHGRWLPAADLVVAGHTLARWLGPLGGTTVLQPWAFGAEIAVADLDAQGRLLGCASALAEPGRAWSGAGSDVLAAARSQRYGVLEQAAGADMGGGRALLDRMAHAMLAVTGADAALLPAAYVVTQPALDGTTAWVPAGEVNELTVQLLVPYPGDQLFSCGVAPEEWRELLRQFTAPHLADGPTCYRGEDWWRLSPGRSQAARLPDEARLTVPQPWLSAVRELLRRPVAWTDTGVTLKQALRLRFCATQDRP